MITGYEPAQTVAPAWADLWRRHGADPFGAPGWHLAWATAFAPGCDTVLTARGRDGTLHGVLPLDRRRASVSLAANAHTPRASVVADGPDALAALARAFARSASAEIVAAPLVAGSAPAAALQAALAGERLIAATHVQMRSPYLDVTADPAEHLARKMRKEIARGGRRLEESGPLTLDVTHAGEDALRGFDDLVRIEGLGWKGEAGTSIAAEPGARDFYGDVVRWAADEGLLWMVVLRAGDTPVAAELDLRHGDSLYSLKMGFDPAYAKTGPGHVMVARLLARAWQDGVRRYEMLGADDAYKMRWTSTVHDVLSLRAFRATPRGLTAYGVRRLAPSVRRRAAVVAGAGRRRWR